MLNSTMEVHLAKLAMTPLGFLCTGTHQQSSLYCAMETLADPLGFQIRDLSRVTKPLLTI